MPRTVLSLAFLALAACTEKVAPHQAVAAKPAAPERPKYTLLSRDDFNFRAQERFLPLFWRSDANHNQALDPDELVLWGPQVAKRADFVDSTGFTKAFDQVYAQLQKPLDFSKTGAEEKRRHDLLLLELSQGRPTLLETDFSKAGAEDKAVAQHLVQAAVGIERLFARQQGSLELASQLASDDPLSQAVFHRNQGPWCVAPKTEKDDACSALPQKPQHLSELYPAALQADPKFCERLGKQKNAKALMDHFTVVAENGAGFKAVPYSDAWHDDMEAVAKELDQAAAALTSPDESAFQTYLTQAARAFRTNDWEPANQAWVAMGPENSKWYARIAPDEVYSEPCAWKAAFALQLARINPDSLEWQKKLEPLKNEMEKTLAGFAGAPYKAREVKFKLPDFIDVVLNAGDQRNPHGATVGQSLPNWGPVAERGGRTVVMTNLYTDPDSQEALHSQMASLFCPATMALAPADAKPLTMSVVLHEASHNLGPAHDYQVKGKKDEVVFGGPLAATMEELKAQTAALFFSGWLAERGVVEKTFAQQANVRDVAWAFGHISRGMYDGAGKPKNYSQLASIQLGALSGAGALVWKPADKAANGTDLGCFDVDWAKWSGAVSGLAKRVLRVKGTGDRAEAEKLKADFVDADDDWKLRRAVITQRWLRAPKATFIYSVRW